MILCISCDKKTKRLMDDLLARGQYTDYSELISVAISNLHMLDQEIQTGRAMFLVGDAPSSTAHPTKPAVKAKNVAVTNTATSQSRQRQVRTSATPATVRGPFRVPGLFLLDGLDSFSISTSELRGSDEASEPFTLDRWLFGQYNKLLPAKASCRGLARLMGEVGRAIPLDKATVQIAEAAAALGDYLADYDSRHQTNRDDALATAFPRTGPDAEKSRARYANHFVGTVNSQGVLSGLLSDYRLATLAVTNPLALQLTAPGLSLARLANPVLDQSQDDPARKLSREESIFLLQHIQQYVPAENFAFRALIAAVQEGADTPESLDESLRVHVPTDSNRSLSPSFLTSQRSGALSRMADLGLLARIRKGVRVSYTITEQGQRFVEGK